MTRRLLAIAFIYLCTSVAWLILGATIFQRTSASNNQLRGVVGSTWGTRQAQRAPVAFIEETVQGAPVAQQPVRRTPPRMTGPVTASTDVVAAPPAPGAQATTVRTPLLLEQTRADVTFDLEHRQKGLLWYSTYNVAFQGAYRFRNTTTRDSVTIEFPLPASQAVYDDLRVAIDGRPVRYEPSGQSLLVDAAVPVGDVVQLAVSYRSQGLEEWRYALGNDVAEVRDFELVMRTDFDDIDFPANALSPTTKQQAGDGWQLRWRYSSLLSGFQIGMTMPEKLQPGPLAGEIAFFAPVSLLFFFAVVFMIVTIRGIPLHPMNYAFLAAGFFAFHILLAYLVDHISIHVAFVIASAVSIGLVVSYLRLAVGPRFAFREAALAQLIYLVLFSYAFFFKGFTGLAITIGSVITLFVAMQLTGRIDWGRAFAGDSVVRREPVAGD